MPVGGIALTVNVVCAVAFLHFMRIGHRANARMHWMGFLNYFWGAVVAGGMCLLAEAPRTTRAEWLFGVSIGIALVGGFYALELSVRLMGAGVTQTIERLTAVLAPTLVSIWIWQEVPTALHVTGFALSLASFTLLGKGRNRPGAFHASPRQFVGLVLLVGSLTSWIGLSFKAYSRVAGEGVHPVFHLAMFGSAAVVSGICAVLVGGLPRKRDVLLGMGQGTANIVGNTAYYVSIEALDAIVVFPTTAAGVIVLSSLLARVIWRERYGAWTIAGLVTAVVALVLINWPAGGGAP